MIRGLNSNENYQPHLTHMNLIKEMTFSETEHLIYFLILRHLSNEFKNQK